MIVTLSEFKKFVNVENTDEDVSLLECLERAQSEAESICDRLFDSQAFVEYYEGKGQSELLLRNYPVTAVSGLNDDWDRAWLAATEIAAAEYQFDGDRGIIILENQVFSKCLTPIQNIKVSYTAGYTSTTAPRALKLGIMKLAASDYLEAHTHLNAVTQTQEGVNKSDELRKEAEKLLERFERIR